MAVTGQEREQRIRANRAEIGARPASDDLCFLLALLDEARTRADSFPLELDVGLLARADSWERVANDLVEALGETKRNLLAAKHLPRPNIRDVQGLATDGIERIDAALAVFEAAKKETT